MTNRYKTSDARRAASARYDSANRERKTYTDYRGKGINYILKHSDLNDLDYFEKLADEAAKDL